ncbi:MAG: PTS transporter subunit EIIC [Defluviitaleaceae bacterium]|nr:PTS transporter subunit EIIC [Defluviitaleaceae bacterium]
MNAIVNFLEKYFVPFAAKIGNQKHLLALRDAFIAMMPITMAGAVAVTLNAILRDLPNDPNVLGPGNFITNNWLSQHIIAMNGIVWGGTLAIISLVLAVTLGYTIAKSYGTNGIAGSIIALAAYVLGLPQSAQTNTTLTLDGVLSYDAINLINSTTATVSADGTSISVPGGAWGFFNFAQFFNPNGLFAVIITSFISVIIFSKLMNSKLKIKLPDSVPPAVSNAFTAILPGLIALYTMALLYRIWNLNVAIPLPTWIMNTIQTPLLNLSQGYIAVIVIVLLVHLLWFFGLHGTNIMAAVLNATYGIAQTQNVEAHALGLEPPFLWVASSFEAFVWPGGAGASLVLIIAVLVLSKREDYKAVGKLSLAPGIFNINEPVMFGLPVVLNPLMFIPFILAPLVTATIAYFATITGIVGPAVIPVVWVMPTILSGFFATAFDPMAIVLTVVNLVVAFLIYAPFIIASNNIGTKEKKSSEVA